MGKWESLGQGVRPRCLPSECHVPYKTQGLSQLEATETECFLK